MRFKNECTELNNWFGSVNVVMKIVGFGSSERVYTLVHSAWLSYLNQILTTPTTQGFWSPTILPHNPIKNHNRFHDISSLHKKRQIIKTATNL